MATPKKRTRDDPAMRRAQIVDEAKRMIAQCGYNGLTVRELAARCGLTNAGVLHHFSSKRILFLAVLESLIASDTEVMAPLVDVARQVSNRESSRNAALNVLRRTVQQASTRPELCRLFAVLEAEALDPAHPGHECFRERERAVLGLFADLVSPYVDDPQPIARQLLASRDGLMLQWVRSGCAFDVVKEWERMISALLPQPAASAPRKKR